MTWAFYDSWYILSKWVPKGLLYMASRNVWPCPFLCNCSSTLSRPPKALPDNSTRDEVSFRYFKWMLLWLLAKQSSFPVYLQADSISSGVSSRHLCYHFAWALCVANSFLPSYYSTVSFAFHSGWLLLYRTFTFEHSQMSTSFPFIRFFKIQS